MMYSATIGGVATPLGSDGLGADDGLGFLFPGMMEMISKVMTPRAPPAAAAAAPVKAPVSFTFCPPGMMQNPQWSSIPEEARGQAAASGVQACLPAPDMKKGENRQCFFTIGSRKFKCDQGEFSRAYSIAKKRAAKRPSGRASIQMQVGGQTIMIPVRAGGPPGAPGAGLPGGAGSAPMRNPQTGAFECGPGLRIERNAQGQVVCAAGGGAGGGMPSPYDRGGGRGRRRGRGRSGRGRRDSGYRDGLGQATTVRTHKTYYCEGDLQKAYADLAAVYGPAQARSMAMRGALGNLDRRNLGFVHYPPDYQSMMFRQGQYAQGLERFNENNAASVMMLPYANRGIPAWMSARVPPTEAGARQVFENLTDAFSGAPLGRGAIY